MRSLIALFTSILLLVTTTGVALAAPGSSGEHAKLYYVSLGDSLAAGVQPIGDPTDLYRTADGYAEQLRTIGQARWEKLSLVKLGCPGETTTTMIDGGICEYSHGSQLDEAVAFLEAHHQLVAFVTIDIGANDFPCQTTECLPAGFAAIQSNLPVILSRLRAAAGPDVPIVGMSLYNPFLGAWLLGPDGQAFALASSQLLGAVNAVLGTIFGAADVPVADVAGAFSSNDFETLVALPGVGEVPINVAKICLWTWVCAAPPLGPDNHANATGYGVIAGAFADALGL
jgi:lysophospholipase L1-like esterase